MKYIAKAVRKALPNLHPKEITNNSCMSEEVIELRKQYPHLNITNMEEVQQVYKANSAELILLVDASGSMDKYQKETAARIQQLVRYALDEDYACVEPRYVSFTTRPKRQPSLTALVEDQETGGTLVSTGIKYIDEIGTKPNRDTYVLLITDGDNWADDTPDCSVHISQLFKQGNIQNFTYIELGGRKPQSLGKAMVAHPYVDAYFEYDLKKTILAN